MSDKYRISAKVQPFNVPGLSTNEDDARLKEILLMVPIRGDRTIGDLFRTIEEIYLQIYTRAGILRIRSLESELGEILHTSFLVEDCFEKRSAATNSSQWTVIVKRQAPTPEEIQEYRSRARAFSFDDLSYARPQGPPSSLSAIELSSNTPSRTRLSGPRAIPEDASQNRIIPSTERELEPENEEEEEEERRFLSPIQTIPSTQQSSGVVASTDKRNALQPVTGNIRQGAVPKSESPDLPNPYRYPSELSRNSPVRILSHISEADSTPSRTVQKQSRRRQTSEENLDDSNARAAKRSKLSQPANQAQQSAEDEDENNTSSNTPSKRKSIWDFESQPEQLPLGSNGKGRSRAALSGPELPIHPPSRTKSRSVALDDRVGIRSSSGQPSKPQTAQENDMDIDDEPVKQVNGADEEEDESENEESSVVDDQSAQQLIALNGDKEDSEDDESSVLTDDDEPESNPKNATNLSKSLEVARQPARSATPARLLQASDAAEREERSKQSSQRLAASLDKERGQIEELRGGVAATPRKKVKLTPHIPGSSTKQNSIRAGTISSQDAADEGLQLLKGTLSPVEITKRVGGFAKDRFAKIDAETLLTIEADKAKAQADDRAKIQDVIADSSAATKTAKPATVISDDDEDEDDDDSETTAVVTSPDPVKSFKAKTSKTTTAAKRRVSFNDTRTDVNPTTNGAYAGSAATSAAPQQASAGAAAPPKRGRGRPTKAETAAKEAKFEAENAERVAQGLAPLEKPKPKPRPANPDGSPRRKPGRPRKDSTTSVQSGGLLEQIRSTSRQPAASSPLAPRTTTARDASVISTTDDIDGQPVKKGKGAGRGRPKGSKNKPKPDKASIVVDDDDSTKVNVIKKKKAEKSAGSSETVNKAKKTTTKAPTNAHAMDESKDRAAVVAASQKSDKAKSPPQLAQQTSTNGSYSRSPAREVDGSSEDESSGSETASQKTTNNQGQQKPSATTSDSDSETDDEFEATTARRKSNDFTKTPAPVASTKSTYAQPKTKSSQSSSQPRLPSAQAPPQSSASQAEAQLQSEDTASNVSQQRRPSFTAVNQKSTNGKYPGLAGLRKKQTIQANPEYTGLMKSSTTTRQIPAFDGVPEEDSSDDSNDSDDLDAPISAFQGNGNASKGYKALLNRLG